jgi:Virulence factor BrkB
VRYRADAYNGVGVSATVRMDSSQAAVHRKAPLWRWIKSERRRFAPSLGNRRWQWSTPGVLLAAALWIGATLVARFYFERIDNYHVSFGRLSGVAMLLVWLYVTNGAILIGGETNSEIEKAADKRH